MSTQYIQTPLKIALFIQKHKGRCWIRTNGIEILCVCDNCLLHNKCANNNFELTTKYILNFVNKYLSSLSLEQIFEEVI